MLNRQGKSWVQVGKEFGFGRSVGARWIEMKKLFALSLSPTNEDHGDCEDHLQDNELKAQDSSTLMKPCSAVDDGKIANVVIGCQGKSWGYIVSEIRRGHL
jgi:hypothetical protein